MRRAFLAAVLSASLLGAVVAAGNGESVPTAAARVIDRTLLCPTVPLGGVREIEVRAHAGIRESPTEWKQLPFAVVSTGGAASSLAVLDNSLAWITAGNPSGTTTVDSETGQWAGYPHTDGTLALNRRGCKASAARVPLTRRGLTGGAASPFEDEFDCRTPQRVLVRVRATLQSPSPLGSTGRFLRTITPVQEAQLAVRTRSAKALVYARVFQSGKAQLFTAPSCVAE